MKNGESWLLILSVLIVNPHPRINRGNCLYMQKWKLTVDPLCQSLICPPQDQQRQSPFHVKVKVDCWSSLCQSLIPRINRGNHLFMWKWKLTVDPLFVNHQSPQDQKRWSPFHKKVKVDCWSSLHQLLILPGSTEAITFSHENESWLLILSLSIIDPPRINRGDCLFMSRVCWSSLCWL